MSPLIDRNPIIAYCKLKLKSRKKEGIKNMSHHVLEASVACALAIGAALFAYWIWPLCWARRQTWVVTTNWLGEDRYLTNRLLRIRAEVPLDPKSAGDGAVHAEVRVNEIVMPERDSHGILFTVDITRNGKVLGTSSVRKPGIGTGNAFALRVFHGALRKAAAANR